MKHRLVALAFGAIVGAALPALAATVYPYFAPGGALSCTGDCKFNQALDLTQGGFVSGPLRTGAGGTGTNTTLTGVVRGGSPLTASELSGDVVTSGSNATTIQANVVTNTRLAQMGANTLKGNNTAGTANAVDLSVAQVQAMLSIPALANPSGLIGLTAVNGVATTGTRSDSTHALDQGIAPTWTGSHTWTQSMALTAGVNGNIQFQNTNTSTGTNATALLGVKNSADDWQMVMTGTGFNTTFLTNGPASGAAAYQYTNQNIPVCYGRNANCDIAITTAGDLRNGQAGASFQPSTGTFTSTFTGFTATITCTSTWYRIGTLVTLAICAGNGTSNTSTFTMTGLPAAIQIASIGQTMALGNVVNGGNSSSGATAVINASSGTVTFNLAGSSGGWSASSTKGFQVSESITYLAN